MSLFNMSQKKFILTISGHDPTSAAGMTMDIMVANKFNFHCLSVINNLTIQDAKKLYKVIDVNEKFFKKSLKNMVKNFEVSGIKIGAVSSNKIIEETVNFLKLHLNIPIVIDPIIKAGGGGLFLKKKNLNLALKKLYPLASVLTPNREELVYLTGFKEPKDSIKKLQDLGISKIYVTGNEISKNIVNTLYVNGEKKLEIKTSKLNKKIHGTGCALSTSILCNLIKSKNLYKSCKEANAFMEKHLNNSLNTGHQEFINLNQ